MREKYYYLRDIQNKPIITVCLVKEGQNIARGLAICSEIDPLCKAKGRAIARNRAIHALRSKINSLRIRRAELVEAAYFFSIPEPFYKSSANPILTNREKNLFEKSK